MNKDGEKGAGEINPLLRTHTVLVEDPNPSTHSGQLKTTHNCSSRGSDDLVCPLRQANTYTGTQIHIKKKKTQKTLGKHCRASHVSSVLLASFKGCSPVPTRLWTRREAQKVTGQQGSEVGEHTLLLHLLTVTVRSPQKDRPPKGLEYGSDVLFSQRGPQSR